MPLVNVQKSVVSVTTSCCRTLLFSTFHPSITEYGSGKSESVFVLNMDIKPTATLSVEIQVWSEFEKLSNFHLSFNLFDSTLPETNVTNPHEQILPYTCTVIPTTNPAASATPSKLTFSPTSSSLSRNFVVRGSPGLTVERFVYDLLC
jgi:hypothetical protein